MDLTAGSIRLSDPFGCQIHSAVKGTQLMAMKKESYYYKKSNREKRQTPRAKGYWCPRCDRSLIRDGERCKACGIRDTTLRRLRKE